MKLSNIIHKPYLLRSRHSARKTTSYLTLIKDVIFVGIHIDPTTTVLLILVRLFFDSEIDLLLKLLDN